MPREPRALGALPRLGRPAIDPAEAERLAADGFISITEAAQVLGIGRSLLCELLASGSLPSAKIGRRRLVSRRALLDFAAARLQEGA